MLTILNKETRQLIKYDYEDIYEGMSDGDRNLFFKRLYEKNKNKDVVAYCSCVPDKEIQLVISKHKNTYYIKRQSIGIEHSPSCKFDGNYEWSKDGWNLENDGTVKINFTNRMYSTHEYSNPKIKNQLKLKEFVVRLLGFTWEIQTKHALKYDRPPMAFDKYFHSIYHICKKIKITDSTNLNDLMGYSKKLSYDLLKKRKRMFVMLVYKNRLSIDKYNYKITLKNPGTEYELDFICSKTSWDKEYKLLKIKKEPLLVAGFVELKKDSPLIFKHITVLPLSLQGAYVRSPYERNLVNRLHLKNRHFVNSFETFRGLTEYKPDILLMDEFPKKVIEILEVKDNLDYMKMKDDKISYFKKVSDFEVQIWDAVRKERIYFV